MMTSSSGCLASYGFQSPSQRGILRSRQPKVGGLYREQYFSPLRKGEYFVALRTKRADDLKLTFQRAP